MRSDSAEGKGRGRLTTHRTVLRTRSSAPALLCAGVLEDQAAVDGVLGVAEAIVETDVVEGAVGFVQGAAGALGRGRVAGLVTGVGFGAVGEVACAAGDMGERLEAEER